MINFPSALFGRGGVSLNIEYINALSTTSNFSFAMPIGHRAGDLILVWQVRWGSFGGSITPNLEDGYTSLASAGGNSSNDEFGYRLSYKFADSDDEVWSAPGNTTELCVAIFRNASGVGDFNVFRSTGLSSIRYPALSVDNESWAFASSAVRNNSSSVDAPPTDYIVRDFVQAATSIGVYTTDGPAVSHGNIDVANAAGSRQQANVTAEILPIGA